MLGRGSDRWASVVFALAIHASVAIILIWSWDNHSPLIVVKPTSISVELVNLVDQPEQAQERPPKPRPSTQPSVPSKVEDEPRETPPKREEIMVLAEPEPMVVEEIPTQPETPRNIDELSLASLLAQEDELREAQSEDEQEASQLAVLIKKIQLRVGSYWSRPPSARNGMQVSLQVRFLPNGEVASVSIINSSNDPAFDRSAINALKLSQPHSYLTDYGLSFFNKNFRSIVLQFSPEDLK